MVDQTLKRKIDRIKLIAFDFDGVFTDGKVTVDQDGKESVVCSRRDTLRLRELEGLGIHLVIISREKNPVVSERCKKMRIECFHGVDEKINILKQLLDKTEVTPEEVLFVGDDINDIECMEYAGVAFTVSDADKRCKEIADYSTERKGGDHAVREICDIILETRLKE